MIELDGAGADPVPEPPHRRPRWYWGGAVVLLAAAIAVAVVGIGPGHTPHPPPPIPVPPPPTSGPLGWEEKLVDAPARGELAGDETFAKAVLDGVTGLVRDPAFSTPLLAAVDRQPHHDQEVRLLFADDIDDQRVVVLALRLPAVVNDNVGRTMVTWLAGPRGASPASLVAGISRGSASTGVAAGSQPATPFTVVSVGMSGTATASVWIGLAPPECTVATTADPAGQVFEDEPTGSYIVRTEATRRPGLWRVSCAGVVREQHPAPTAPPSPTDADVAAIIADAGLAQPPSINALRMSLQAMVILAQGDVLTGTPRLLWAGPLPQPELLGARAGAGLIVTVAPALAVGWLVNVWVWDNYFGDRSGPAGSDVFTVSTNPEDLLGFVLNSASDQSAVLVAIAPPGVHTVRVLTASGSVLSEAPVTDRLAMVPAPTLGSPPVVRVQVGDDPAVWAGQHPQAHPTYDWE